MVDAFVKLGARFSFSAYFALESKSKKRAPFDRVPVYRLLIETDAPDMLGPHGLIEETLFDGEGRAINSPLNLIRIYEYVADMKGMALDELCSAALDNLEGLFG